MFSSGIGGTKKTRGGRLLGGLGRSPQACVRLGSAPPCLTCFLLLLQLLISCLSDFQSELRVIIMKVEKSFLILFLTVIDSKYASFSIKELFLTFCLIFRASHFLFSNIIKNRNILKVENQDTQKSGGFSLQRLRGPSPLRNCWLLRVACWPTEALMLVLQSASGARELKLWSHCGSHIPSKKGHQSSQGSSKLSPVHLEVSRRINLSTRTTLCLLYLLCNFKCEQI